MPTLPMGKLRLKQVNNLVTQLGLKLSLSECHADPLPVVCEERGCGYPWMDLWLPVAGREPKIETGLRPIRQVAPVTITQMLVTKL